jgi:hypothetical protein
MKRRTFIKASLAALVAGAGGRILIGELHKYELDLQGFLEHTEAAKRVGQIYLNHHGELTDGRAMIHHIHGENIFSNFKTLPQQLHSQISSEYRHKDWEVIEGWYLTRTEWYLAALVAGNGKLWEIKVPEGDSPTAPSLVLLQ